MVQHVNIWKPSGPDPLSSGYNQTIEGEMNRVKEFLKRLGLKKISKKQFKRAHTRLKAKGMI